MKTWNEVIKFIRSNCEVSDSYYEGQNAEKDWLKIIVNCQDRRSQMVFVNKLDESYKTGSWIQIASPCGIINNNDLNSVLEYLGNEFCGGLVKIGNHHFVRDTMPIDDLSPKEFDAPFQYVASYADIIERKWVGGDKQ